MIKSDLLCKKHNFLPCTCRDALRHGGLGPFDGGRWALSDGDMGELVEIIMKLRKTPGAALEAAKLNLLLDKLKEIWIPGSGW